MEFSSLANIATRYELLVEAGSYYVDGNLFFYAKVSDLTIGFDVVIQSNGEDLAEVIKDCYFKLCGHLQKTGGQKNDDLSGTQYFLLTCSC